MAFDGHPQLPGGTVELNLGNEAYMTVRIQHSSDGPRPVGYTIQRIFFIEPGVRFTAGDTWLDALDDGWPDFPILQTLRIHIAEDHEYHIKVLVPSTLEQGSVYRLAIAIRSSLGSEPRLFTDPSVFVRIPSGGTGTSRASGPLQLSGGVQTLPHPEGILTMYNDTPAYIYI